MSHISTSSLGDFADKIDLPAGTVAVVQRPGLWVVEAKSPLLRKDLVPALVKILIDPT